MNDSDQPGVLRFHDATGTATLPPGTILVPAPIQVWNTFDFTLQGDPAQGTTLAYIGPARDAAGNELGLLDIRGAYAPVFRNLTIQTRTPDTPYAVRISSRPGPTPRPHGFGCTAATFDQVHVHAPHIRPAFVDAFRVSEPEWDNNCDLHRWSNCTISLFTRDGIRIQAPQAQQLVMDRCRFIGYAGGLRAIHGYYGAYFTARDCTATSLRDVDVLAWNGVTSVNLVNWNTENARQLLRTGGPSGATPGISVMECRADQMDAELPHIDYRFAGLLRVAGGTLFAGTGFPRIDANWQASVDLMGVPFSTGTPLTDANRYAVLTGGSRNARSFGSTLSDTAGTRLAVPVDPTRVVG